MISDHHRVWLGAHPSRSIEWLRHKLDDGFDIHHVDGDHLNNDPLNLVLIESADHQLVIHGHIKLRRLIKPKSLSNHARAYELAQGAYDLYARGNLTWAQVADEFGFPKWQVLMAAVADHASCAKLKWPIFEEHPTRRRGHPAYIRATEMATKAKEL